MSETKAAELKSIAARPEWFGLSGSFWLVTKFQFESGMGSEFSVDDSSKLVGRERFKRNLTTIKKDCWCTRYSQRVRALSIQENPLLNNLAANVALELLKIQTDLSAIPFEDRPHVKSLVPGFLVLVNQIMHFPELALQARRLGSSCGSQRMGMGGHQRKLTKNDSQACAELALHRFKDWVEQPTGRTFEVAKLFECCWSCGGA